MARRDWCLFIDETGDFVTERSLVAGVLLEERDTPKLDRALRDLLVSAVPFDVWPLHAAHLNTLPFAPAAWVARGRAKASLGAVLSDAARTLEGIDRDGWAACVAAAAQPRALEPFLALAPVARSDVKLAGILEGARNQIRADVGRAISGFASNYRRGAFVVGASVDPTDEAEADTDRYLRALAVLFERVYALLRGSGEHVVWVIPATRDVRAINGWARFHLRPKDVGDRIAEAERFPLGAPKSGERDRQVRLVAGMPRAYDGHAHGGIVLADFVANSLRLPSAQARFWSEIVEVGADAFGLSLERAAGLLAAAGPLPCIAADGAARVAVAAVMADASAKPVLPTSPGWARDQAARWVVAGRRRAGAFA